MMVFTTWPKPGHRSLLFSLTKNVACKGALFSGVFRSLQDSLPSILSDFFVISMFVLPLALSLFSSLAMFLSVCNTVSCKYSCSLCFGTCNLICPRLRHPADLLWPTRKLKIIWKKSKRKHFFLRRMHLSLYEIWDLNIKFEIKSDRWHSQLPGRGYCQ